MTAVLLPLVREYCAVFMYGTVVNDCTWPGLEPGLLFLAARLFSVPSPVRSRPTPLMTQFIELYSATALRDLTCRLFYLCLSYVIQLKAVKHCLNGRLLRFVAIVANESSP